MSIVSSIIERLGYDDIIEGCYDLGIYGLELSIKDELLSLERKKELDAFLKKLRTYRIKVAAVSWGSRLPERSVAKVARALYGSPHLDTMMIKLMPPHRTKPSISDIEYAKRTAERLRLILERTDDLNVELTLENHGAYDRPLGVKKEFLQTVLELVNDDRFGICLDTGCFYWYYPLDDYYEVTEHFLPYVNHTHLKNQTFSPEQKYRTKKGTPVGTAHENLYEGDIDLKRVINMLKGVGYEGDLCIEDHSIGRLLRQDATAAARGVIRKDVEFLRSII